MTIEFNSANLSVSFTTADAKRLIMFASKDATRVNLTPVVFDLTQECVQATDGRVALALQSRRKQTERKEASLVPRIQTGYDKEGDDGVTRHINCPDTVSVPQKLLQSAAKLAGTKGTITLAILAGVRQLSVAHDGTLTNFTIEADSPTWPDFSQIFPKRDKFANDMGTCQRYAIKAFASATILADLVGEESIEFWAPQHGLDPCILSAVGAELIAHMVVMPMRKDPNRPRTGFLVP